MSAVAASFEVSTRTLRKWLARFRRGGRTGLALDAVSRMTGSPAPSP